MVYQKILLQVSVQNINSLRVHVFPFCSSIFRNNLLAFISLPNVRTVFDCTAHQVRSNLLHQYSVSRSVLQGLFVPFARVGSGDPVRVLHLLHNKYVGYNWSIYCWDICTTCLYRNYVLRYCRMCTSRDLTKNDCPTLYCVVPYTVACVDISRTVFRDRSVWPDQCSSQNYMKLKQKWTERRRIPKCTPGSANAGATFFVSTIG